MEREGGGIRISLPPRPLGAGRLAGLFLIPFGLVFSLGPLSGALDSEGDHGCFRAFIFLFVTPFVVIGVLVIALGMWFLFPGRTRLSLDRHRLRTTERLGLFWWSWTAPREKLRGFQVRETQARRGAQPSAVLEVEVEGRSRKFTFGQGYPADWLEGVARALAEVHGSAAVAPTVQAPPAPAAFGPASSSSVSQPARSDIVLEYTADSVRLTVPRKGIWKANGCLLLFGILWSTMSGIGLVAALSSGVWGGAAFVLLFVAIGAAFILGSIHSGIKTAELELSGASLVLRKSGVFGRKLRQWPRASIQKYSVEDSGWEVNDVRQWQLRVDLAEGKPLKLLRGRSNAELEWISSVLRSGPIGHVEATGAECQVCNAPMTTDIVYCARCKTPHHGQCWQYLGQCSTYGCREIRYTTS